MGADEEVGGAAVIDVPTAGDAGSSPPAAPVERTAPQGMVPDIRKLAPRIIVAGVLPFAAYAVLRSHVSSDAVGLAIVSVFPALDIVVERVRRGRFDPIGVIALIGIVLGIIGAVALGGTDTLLKLRESSLTGVFGVVCLLSLLARRPVMYYLARAFSTDGDAEKVAEFDQIWDLPGVPSRFRLVTIVWGVGLIAETAVRTWLAFVVSTQTFLGIAHVIGWVILGGLLAWTTAFSKRGERAVLAAVEEGEGVTADA